MYPSRKNKKGRIRTLRLRGLLLLVGAVVLAIAALFIFDVFKIGSTSKSSLKNMGFTVDSEYVYTGNGYLYIKGSELFYEDLGKGKNWQSELASGNVWLAASPTINVVYNSVSMLPLSKEGTKLFEPVEYAGAVTKVKCGINQIAVLKLDAAGTPNIYIYDSAGVGLDVVPFARKSVVDFGFFGATDMLWVHDINTSGVSIMTTISIIQAGQSTQGNIPIDGQTIEKLFFTDKNIYAAGTSHLLSFDLSGKEQDRKLIYGWKVQDYANISAKPYFLITPRPTANNSQVGIAKLVVFPSTTKDVLLTLPAGSLGAWIMGDTIVSVTRENISYFNFKGELKKTLAFDTPISGVQKINDRNLLIELGKDLYISKVR